MVLNFVSSSTNFSTVQNLQKLLAQVTKFYMYHIMTSHIVTRTIRCDKRRVTFQMLVTTDASFGERVMDLSVEK